jgi:class 3 adenylate cyclase/tetratricopeptide (TPR) repeat protein
MTPAWSPTRCEVRKTVTVLFASLEPPEGADSIDLEAQRRIADRAFAEISAAVEHHGGTVEALAGDSLTAVFGVPVVHEDDALRAVRAAADFGERPEIRLGLSTGEVITGGRAGEPRSTGRPITVAARLAQAAAPGELLLDRATHRVVKEAVDVEDTEHGLRLVSVRTNLPVLRSRFDAPMVGRERERRRLYDAFGQAVADSSCQLFSILGAAGVGKSRLVREFLEGLGDRATVVRGRCLPYGKGITYFPLMEAVSDAVGLEDTDSPEEGLAKIAALLDVEEDDGVVARRVGELIGLAEVGGGAHESFAAVRLLFESIALRAPLVVVFDDIHWGEATFLDLIEHLADWVRGAPVLLVCIARPELLDVRPGWAGGKLNATTVLLEPLSEEESAQLVESLAGNSGLDEAACRRIVEGAEGNPLLVEEMLALAIEDSGAEGFEVPPTIQSLLAARLDRLSPAERTVIECAAVEGKLFHEQAVEELVPSDVRSEAASALGSLLLKELIRPDRPGFGGRTYHFRHQLIRDAAYDSIPKEARADLHERFGRWLDKAAGDRSIEYEEVVGYHLEQAHRYLVELGPLDESARQVAREAAERLGAAARRALVRSDGPAGLNLSSRAVALLSPDDPLRVELVPNARTIQGLRGEMEWADRVLTEAIEAAATSGDRGLAAHALVQRGLLRLFTEAEVTPDELFGVAERATAVFREVDDELGVARAWRLKAQAHYLARNGAACADASERALVHARRAGDLFEQRETVEWLAIALLLGSTPAVEAARRCEKAFDDAAGDPVQEMHLVAALAYLVAMEDRLDEAEALMARARGLVEQLGQWIWIVSWHAAVVLRWMGDPQTAVDEIRPAYEALKAIGEKSHFSTMAQGLAAAAYESGDYDEAERAINECREAARPNDVYSQIMWRSILAKLLARQGRFKDATRLADEAVRFAADSDFHLGHADALTDLAEVLELQADRDGAAAAIREAIGFYELKGNLPAAERTRVRLAKLDRAGQQ